VRKKIINKSKLDEKVTSRGFVLEQVTQILLDIESNTRALITSNRDWFDTYRSVNFGIVTTGNGAHCKITGIGNIRIKMFEVVVRIFCDVRHVLDVEKNLISLGTLDSNGYPTNTKFYLKIKNKKNCLFFLVFYFSI
jgi:hypothetical protein